MEIQELKKWYAGMAGFALIETIQLSTADKMDYSLKSAVFLFAFAIPLLTIAFITPMEQLLTKLPVVVGGVGFYSCLGGFGFLFFHFGPLQFAAFVAAIGVATVTFLKVYKL